MEKRTLLAIALSFLVIGLYPIMLQKMYPQHYAAHPKAAATAPAAVSLNPFSKEKPALQNPASDRGTFLPSQDVVYQNDKVKITFNKKGGAVREVYFREFADPETRQPLRLFSWNDADGSPFLIDWAAGQAAPSVASDYTVEASANQIRMTGTAASGLGVSKTFTFDPGGYSGTLTLALDNRSGAPLEGAYRLFVGRSIPARNAIDNQYIETNFYSEKGDKSSLRHIKAPGAGKTIESGAPLKWLAVKDRQFSIIVKPKDGEAFSGLITGLGNHRAESALVSPTVALPAGASVKQEFVFYIGPNEIQELAPVGLDPLINFGKFDWIAKLLLGALELLHNVFRNYGISIIALTASINLLLFPFTRTSYLAMKRMQLIQPQMNKLREQHKKNPDKLNKEMMELYKKHKVNPFGGCLPMLVQMPVFIALYVALSKSVILMNSRFLWINDLSSPDKVYLPFSLPVIGNPIHVLPFIMVGAMMLQQRFTQIKMDGQDPSVQAQQKMMTVMMPVIFGFIFYAMPAGLVLYWLTNTLLMTFYQLHLKNITLT